jgi:hypothetical protein
MPKRKNSLIAIDQLSPEEIQGFFIVPACAGVLHYRKQ